MRLSDDMLRMIAAQAQETAELKWQERDARMIHRAVEQLSQSETGRDTLRRMLEWFEASGCNLDAENKYAVLRLIEGAWGSAAGTTLDAMREALR